jgi:pyridoxine 5-phosphate synthase
MSELIRLGVNIDHVATLRNARGGAHPDPFAAAQAAVAAGADRITLHLREDRRHIRDADAERLCAWAAVPINLEMAATEEMLAIACRLRPNAVLIVPERRAELTTEGGLDVIAKAETLKAFVGRLNDAGIVVSLFIDPSHDQVLAAVEVSAAAVELHTGAYAHGSTGELARLTAAAALTGQVGLECHAGHGLTFDNVGPVAAIPEVRELNIGHFLIGEAIFMGLPAAIREMRGLMDAARR